MESDTQLAVMPAYHPNPDDDMAMYTTLTEILTIQLETSEYVEFDKAQRVIPVWLKRLVGALMPQNRYFGDLRLPKGGSTYFRSGHRWLHRMG